MKTVLTQIAVVVTSVSLVSCSTNTQKENTAIGAVTGGVLGGLTAGALGGNAAAIGASVIVGALIGGVIGHSMDSIDKSNVYAAVSTGKPMSWHNSKTNTVYTVTPAKKFSTINGNPYCRQYTVTSRVDGSTKVDRAYGTACRQADGTWKSIK